MTFMKESMKDVLYIPNGYTIVWIARVDSSKNNYSTTMSHLRLGKVSMVECSKCILFIRNLISKLDCYNENSMNEINLDVTINVHSPRHHVARLGFLIVEHMKEANGHAQ